MDNIRQEAQEGRCIMRDNIFKLAAFGQHLTFESDKHLNR